MAEAAKRSHDPSTGDTPGKKPEKRRSKKSGRFVKDVKKSLFQSELSQQRMWKESMTRYLTLHVKKERYILN